MSAPKVRARKGAAKAFFLAALDRDSDDCIIWPFGHVRGYGRISVGNRNRCVHQVVCEIAHGPRPPGRHALHTCDQPSCINRRHIFWGTASQNMQQMWDRGRHPKGRRSTASRSAPAADCGPRAAAHDSDTGGS
jgi:hypothetical protein